MIREITKLRVSSAKLQSVIAAALEYRMKRIRRKAEIRTDLLRGPFLAAFDAGMHYPYELLVVL